METTKVRLSRFGRFKLPHMVVGENISWEGTLIYQDKDIVEVSFDGDRRPSRCMNPSYIEKV